MSLRFLVRDVFATEPAELAELEPVGRLLLVLGGAVVAPFALTTGHLNNVAHWCSL